MLSDLRGTESIIQKIDAEKRLAEVFATGQERTARIAADVKIQDEAGCGRAVIWAMMAPIPATRVARRWLLNFFMTDPQAKNAFTLAVDTKKNESAEAAWWLGRTMLHLKEAPAAIGILDKAIADWPQSELVPALNFTRIEAIYEDEKRRAERARIWYPALNSSTSRYPSNLYPELEQSRTSVCQFVMGSSKFTRTDLTATRWRPWVAVEQLEPESAKRIRWRGFRSSSTGSPSSDSRCLYEEAGVQAGWV